MILLEDTRNQINKHDLKHKYFEKTGIEYQRCRLYVGDYTLANDQSICIDTKKDIQELVGDICGKSHERFRNELLRAQEANIKLIILVENVGGLIKGTRDIYNPTITELSQLHSWKNPRLFICKHGRQLYPTAVKGQTLMKACYTMEKKYGCEFLFCRPEEAGKRIVEILTDEKTGTI